VSVSSQELTTPPRKVDEEYNPRIMHQEMAQRKAEALERRFEREKLLVSAAVTNWQEYDITYYDTYWYPDYGNQSIYGEVGIYGYPTVDLLDSIMLNLSNHLTVDSIYDASGNLVFTHEDDHLTVFLDHDYTPSEQFGFTVVYEGQPDTGFDNRAGMYFYTEGGSPLITTSSQPYGARQWWPCNDIPLDKADSLDIRIRAGNGYSATSNGIIVSDVDNGDGTHTVHWRHRYPITSYLVCLAIGDYAVWEDYYVYSPTDSMPIVNYVHPEHYDTSLVLFSVTAESIEIFADLFGEYPFINEKYGHTHYGSGGGGMEHQTNTFIGAHSWQPTVVHEAAHMWWGDLVTCRDWANIWLNEGFASYCEALYFEAKYGFDYYYMEYFETYTPHSIYVTDTSRASLIFSLRVYDKGAWVLHMLRHMVGDSLFFDIFAPYRDAFAYQTVVTEDFQAICESVTSMELESFFQQWIYGVGWPVYRHAFYTEEIPGGGWDTYIHIRQIQTTDPQVFAMPLDLRFHLYSGDSADFRVFNDQRDQDFFVFHTDDEPSNIELDPDNWVLEKNNWEQYRLRILNDSLSDGVQGEPYLDSVIAKGSYPGNDQHHVVIAGELPSGLNLEVVTGIISGTTYATGDFSFTIEVTDEVFPMSYADTMSYSIYIAPTDPRPGDANVDSEVSVGDVVFLINHIFKGGPAPEVPNWADANADCEVSVGDAVYLINHIFREGPAPQMGCVE
jgi:aminopeptidase N